MCVGTMACEVHSVQTRNIISKANTMSCEANAMMGRMRASNLNKEFQCSAKD
jgi:hypothetical protein